MKLKKNILIIIPTLIILVLLIILYLEAPNFFRIRNLTNILVQSSALGILAIGMCVVFITGGIDLSLPSNMAFGAIIGSNYIVYSGDPIVGSIIMIVCCLLIGCINGIAVSYLNMTPFIILVSYLIADTTRVFFTRLLTKKSPMTADTIHFHHLMLKQSGSYLGTIGSIFVVKILSLLLLLFSDLTSTIYLQPALAITCF